MVEEKSTINYFTINYKLIQRMGKKNNIQKHIVHFDLGGSKISALAGIVDENGALTVLGEEKHSTDDIKSGVIEKVTSVAYKVNELSKLLQNSLRIEPVKMVSLSISPRSMRQSFKTINRAIERRVTQDFLNKIRNELKAEINSDKVYVYEIEALEYFIDGKPIEEPIGRSGSNLRVDYRIITGNIQVQESTERCFERTGIEVDYIHLGIEATATVSLEDDDRKNGCALIAFGATTTTLAIYNEGTLQDLLIVPFGGLNITKDIQELGISFENAELLKTKKGSALESLVKSPINIKAPAEDPEKQHVLISTAFLATIIEARLSEMMEPIFDVINQITYRLQNGIVITGGASKLNNLKEFITEKTGFQVRDGNHSEWLTEETDEKFLQPEYAQAIGAMLLSHDKNEEKLKNDLAGNDPKIKRKILDKLADKFNKGMGDLFAYDEIE